ncbi:MAG: hypothetical protein JXR94_13670 [Candidatus Hydrogenedentes bacterium]|nr:hypothetical protein [Candidatus Hydrogenedentota bacterium]
MATRVEQSLNGPWRLILDPDDVGKEREWFAARNLPDAMGVLVPSVWDRWVPDYDGVGWYLREFDLPPDWQGRAIALEFEAVDYAAEVWLNGTPLGGHEGGYTPFALDASDAALPGDTNRLAVRVVDPHGPDGFGPYKPHEIPTAKEHGYFSFAGIWGDVRIVGRPQAHIEDVFIQPDVRRKRITVSVATSEPGQVRIGIENTPYQLEGEPGELVLEFPEFETWSPEAPVLYTLRCELLQDGAVADSTSVRFGMREFAVKENRFYLNNRPIFLKGALLQPDYPRTLAAPESEAMARRELELAKEAGFNLIRLHIKTAPRITLDLADEIGLLIYEEPPIGWIKKSEHMAERCTREVREMILRDRNHPSVVIWGMLNESGNAGYEIHGGAQTIKNELCALARSLDPSRLIIDDSGGVNATREPARMMRPYHDEFEVYDDLHIYQRAPVDSEIELYLRHSGDPERLFFLSEFGFGGMEDLADVLAQYGDDGPDLKDARFLRTMLDAALQGFSERGLDRLFGDFSGFTAAARELQCDAARYQIDALRLNAKLAGYCYTQLCDAGHEFCAGVLDRWRRPKPAFETLKKAQSPLRTVVHVARTTLRPRQEVAVTVTIVNDNRLQNRADLSLQVVGPTNQVLWKKKRNVKLPRTGRELWSGTISASGSTGPHKFVVRLMDGMKVLAENAAELQVFAPTEPCDVEFNIVDPDKEWTARCRALAKAGAENAPIHIVPPLANTIRAYPEAALTHVISQVLGGAVALVFGPPDDWNDLADQIDPAMRATSKDAVGAFLGVYHYAKLHPVFEGLPARGLMRQPYRNTVPPKTFLESSDEDICGAFDTAPIATGNYLIGETSWWGSDILVRRLGSGRIVFTHLRVLEHLGEDPVADRLFVNLLTHFAKRSVPSRDAPPVSQQAAHWIRREQTDRTRMWMCIGMFPNWGDQGHNTAYPPEERCDFSATYPGWYRPISWRRWYSLADSDHVIDLQQAFTPVYEYYPRFDCGTGYAYAECVSERRQSVRINLGVQDATKVWINGRLVFEDARHRPHRVLEQFVVDGFLKQGRNTVLVKVSKMPGEFRFSLDFSSATRDPLSLRWWR